MWPIKIIDIVSRLKDKRRYLKEIKKYKIQKYSSHKKIIEYLDERGMSALNDGRYDTEVNKFFMADKSLRKSRTAYYHIKTHVYDVNYPPQPNWHPIENDKKREEERLHDIETNEYWDEPNLLTTEGLKFIKSSIDTAKLRRMNYFGVTLGILFGGILAVTSILQILKPCS